MALEDILFASQTATIVSQSPTHVINTTTWLPGNVSSGSNANNTFQERTSIITTITTTRGITSNTTAGISISNHSSPALTNNTLPEVITDEPEVFSNLEFENASSVVIGALILVGCLAVVGLILRFTVPLLRIRCRRPNAKETIKTHLEDTDPSLGHVSDIKFGARAWAESSSSGSIESNQSQDWSDVSSSQTKITDDSEESQSKSSEHSGNHRTTPPLSVIRGSTVSLFGHLLHESLDPARLENRFRSRWSDHDHWETQSYRPNSNVRQQSRLIVTPLKYSPFLAQFPLPTRTQHEPTEPTKRGVPKIFDVSRQIPPPHPGRSSGCPHGQIQAVPHEILLHPTLKMRNSFELFYTQGFRTKDIYKYVP